MSCDQNHIRVVVNSIEVENKQFRRPEGVVCPSSLAGNLVLMKGFVTGGIWNQVQGRVTNLNLFSGVMSTRGMVEMTSGGNECRKQEGDFLSWTNSSWRLEGSAKWGEVPLEDLCKKEPSIRLFTTQVVERPDECVQLCSKIHKDGRMASVETPELFDKLKHRMRMIANVSKSNMIIWVPMSRREGVWVDTYTQKIFQPEFQPGHPIKGIDRNCGIWSPLAEGCFNSLCVMTTALGGWYCACDFPQHPFLTLRGLCTGSHIDETYLPLNNRLDGGTTYYGVQKTSAIFVKRDNQWKMTTSVFNTTAVSDEIGGRFMLGKQSWTIEGDSKKCQKGKPYNATLKLTSCKAGEFTCDDGQCVKIKERCDQVPDCKDESDEKGCQLLILRASYNKNIAPVLRKNDKKLLPVNVNVTITLMKVVEIEETDHSIHLKFQIMLDWRETDRVTYHNLKEDSSLNTLKDFKELWLPLLVYDNTDQEESTRLAPFDEWTTTVALTREGNFTRSETHEVDEIEMFKGPENKLTMNQTYTKAFQCEYKLSRYPFDIQVYVSNISLQEMLFPPRSVK